MTKTQTVLLQVTKNTENVLTLGQKTTIQNVLVSGQVSNSHYLLIHHTTFRNT